MPQYKVIAIDDIPAHLHGLLYQLNGLIRKRLNFETHGLLIETETRILYVNNRHEESEISPIQGKQPLEILVEKIEELSPDLITLDQLMPIEGTDIYEKLRNKKHKMPIIFVTVVAEHDRKINELVKTHKENTSLLAKPYSFEQLYKTVLEYISQQYKVIVIGKDLSHLDGLCSHLVELNKKPDIIAERFRFEICNELISENLVENINAQEPDLILMDMSIAEDIYGGLRDANYTKPIIFYNKDGVENKVLRNKIDKLRKGDKKYTSILDPFTPEQLYEVVLKHINQLRKEI